MKQNRRRRYTFGEDFSASSTLPDMYGVPLVAIPTLCLVKMISNFMNLDMKLWMRTTLKHVQDSAPESPYLRKSGGAFGDLPIVKAIIGCVKLDVLQWIYERTNGNDGYLFDWKNSKGQTLLHICAQGNRKFQDSRIFSLSCYFHSRIVPQCKTSSAKHL